MKTIILLIGILALQCSTPAQQRTRNTKVEKSDDPRIQLLTTEIEQLKKDQSAFQAKLSARQQAGIKPTKTDHEIIRSFTEKVRAKSQAIARIKLETEGRSAPGPKSTNQPSFSAPPPTFVPAAKTTNSPPIP